MPLLANTEQTSGYEAFAEELNKRRKARDDFAAAKHAELLDTSRQRVTDYLVRVASNEHESLLAKLPYLSLGPEELKPRLVERWRDYLRDQVQPDDALFGPWKVLVALPDDTFSQQASQVVAQWTAKPLGLSSGHINPLVHAALAEPPQSKIDVARRYGKLLEDAYAAWKQAGGNSQSLAKLSPPQHQLAQVLLDKNTPTDIPADDLEQYLNRADRNQHSELQKRVDEHQVQSPGAPPRAMILVDDAQPRSPRVFIRGNHARPGKPVPRQFVGLLTGEDRQPFTDGSGRLELARAIVDPQNPLTARVIVNRVWMHHFGEPLVLSPSDFGVRSQPPSHPELLDYLAVELQQSGWSLKALHRTIMLSNTYQQASADRPQCHAADPENRLLWRTNRRRLEFEPLRDALLAVAGQLDTTMHGRPVDLFGTSPVYRRAVYGLIDRQDLPGLLRTFDFASPDQSSERRPRTTVPQQALFMMNSAFVAERAKALSARQEVISQSEPAQRIASLYRLVLSREATPDEIAIGQQFVEAAEQETSSAGKLSAWEQYAQLLLLTNEFMYVD